jgi:PAS domain S-box-containing protein
MAKTISPSMPKQRKSVLPIPEKIYRILIENTLDGVYIIAPQEGFEYVNPAFERMAGYKAKEIYDKNFNSYSLIHPEDRKLIKRRKIARRTGKPVPPQFTIRLLTKEGKTKHVEVNTVVLSGDKTRVLGTVRDVSDRIRSEETLKFERQQLLSIFESIDEPIYVSDPDTFEVLFANQALRKIFGSAKRKICFKAFQGRSSPCPFCTNKHIFGENLGKPYIWEFQNEFNKRFYRCIDRAIRWPSGKMVRCEVAVDITEQKTAEKVRRNSEERYRDLVEKAGIAILIDDQEGNFKYANKRYAEMFGYRPEEMRNQSIQSVVHPDDVERVMKYHKGRLEGKNIPSRYEFKGIKKDGSPIYLEVDVVVLKNGGAGIGTRSYLWDITDRKKAENEANDTMRKLRKALDGTINAIALTVEARDPSTSGHQRRVADLARTIATEMGISKDRIEGLRSAGVIHDLGKICVPADILSKPSKLSESEFSLIKIHPQVGYDILKDIEFPWPVATIIHQHHERMNGSGYPQGLSGDDILLEARIVAVADVVEAMSSHRPYRPSLGLENALSEISENKGILYDPAVVETCLRLFSEKKYAFK